MKTIKDVSDALDIPRGSRGGTVSKIKAGTGIEGVLQSYGGKIIREYSESEYERIIAYLKGERVSSTHLGMVYNVTKEQTNTTPIPKIEKNREKGFYHRLTLYGGTR